MTVGARMRVVHVQRRPHAFANFSVEGMFDLVRRELAGTVDISVVMPTLASRGVLARLAIAREVAAQQGDVTHVLGDITFVAASLDPTRTIVTVLDCVHETLADPIKRLLLEWLWLKRPVARAARVTAISAFTRDRIVALTGCAASKVTVIPPALSPRFMPTPATFNTACPRVLLVGTAPNKNVERALGALAGVPCTVVIVGRLDDALQRVVAGAGLAVENPVNLTDAAMLAEYQRCDLVLFASTYEGFGLPIVEAQAVARPVVTSAIGAMPQAAGDGAAFVDPYDVAAIRAAVQRVIADVSYRESLVARGIVNARRFAPGPIAAQYRTLYEDVYARRTIGATTG